MEKSEIKRILAPFLCSVERLEKGEQGVFSDKNDGWFYKFGLPSGQRFGVHVPAKDKTYTLRPMKNLIPGLREIQWEKTKDTTDGYITRCYMDERVPVEEVKFIEKLLSPQPVQAPFLTKADSQNHSYHPMLNTACWLQRLKWQHEDTTRTLLARQKTEKSFLVSSSNRNIQQKLKERRQNG